MMFRFLLAFALTGAMCLGTSAAEPIKIGSRLEPLVDNFLIDTMTGARLVLNMPTPREVAIVHDAPWEGNTSGYHTVFQDGDIYRLYYRGCHHGKARKGGPQQKYCYAESKDGIHWTKPKLGLFEWAGSKENNIVWSGPGAHNFAPFKDTNPACKPDEKYKALASGKGGLVAFTSPDGINWKLTSEKPVITKGAFDSQNQAFWDETRGCYVEFHRGFRDGVRDIMTCTSTDFQKWTEPDWIAYPGAPKEHLYTNQITPYYRAPHILMGFPKRFMPSRRTWDPRPGLSDGVFMTSRDGQNFHRWGEAFIRPGPQKERWVNRNNMTARGIVVTKSSLADAPDELSIYSTEGYYQGEDCKLRRYTLRVDGFVSIRAPLAGGQFVTKPIVFEGKELLLNFATSAAGGIRVEIQGADGKPIEGFALADCPAIFGDTLQQAVVWKGGSDVSKLAGKPVRLRFELKDADLYSIRFQ